MMIENYYIVANTREEFKNESCLSKSPYSDHPSQRSIDFVVSELNQAGFATNYFGGIEALIHAYEERVSYPKSLFLNFSDGLSHPSRKAQSAMLLEMIGVPYAGSEPLSRLIAGNKAYAKKLVSPQLDTPQGTVVFDCDSIPTHLHFPVIIKPNREGSSVGIFQTNFCRNMSELENRLPVLLNKYGDVLIEEYIPGYEITCFIIGNKGNYYLTEPIICEYDHMRYFEDFIFGLEEKANRKRSEFLARNIFSSQQIELIQKAARTAFELLGMQDFARADFRLQKNGRLVFLEINGNAVISETSEIGVISRELQIPFGTIVGDIIRTASARLNITI